MNGLVADRSQPGSPATIASVGFALAVYPVGGERNWITRTDATRPLALLRFTGPVRRERRPMRPDTKASTTTFSMRACPFVVAGLRWAGFTNGWL